MPKQINQVLDQVQVRQKIKRIAFEIFENNFKEKSIVLAGITGNGFRLAEMLAKELDSICAIEPIVVEVKLDKDKPKIGNTILKNEAVDYKNRPIVLVDDVLNTGRTLAYCMYPFLEIGTKKIEVAVLVNRRNPLYPIEPLYTGYELSTMLSDRVEVVLNKKMGVYII